MENKKETIKEVFVRVKDRILLINSSPFSELEAIRAEPSNVSWHKKKFVVPMMLAITVATFLGYLLALSIYNYSFVYIAIKAVSAFCESFFTLWVSSLILKELAVKLKSPVGYSNLFKLMTYSFSAFFAAEIVAGFLANYKTLGSFIKFLGLFGIFPFWIGCEMLLNISAKKRLELILVSLIVVLVVYFLISWSFGFALRAAHIAGMLNENP